MHGAGRRGKRSSHVSARRCQEQGRHGGELDVRLRLLDLDVGLDPVDGGPPRALGRMSHGWALLVVTSRGMGPAEDTWASAAT
jgi:hypothetical protein